MRKSNRQLWTECIADLENNKERKSKLSNAKSFRINRGCDGVILGVDPSLRGTGVAVIESKNKNLRFIFSQRLSIALKLSFYDCLGKLYNEISLIIDKFQPNFVAMEQTIFVQNYKIAQILGSVRGAIVAALVNRQVKIVEYAPLRIKQAVSGFGRASKEQVLRTIKNVLHITSEISYDEADALAVACCHAWTFEK